MNTIKNYMKGGMNMNLHFKLDIFSNCDSIN